MKIAFIIIFLVLFIFLLPVVLLLISQSYHKTPQPQPQPTPTVFVEPTKSGADLSYIMISGDKDIEIVVKDASGQSVGESHTEQPIIPPGATTTSMKARKVFYYYKPTSGMYTISLSAPSTGLYKYEIYLYDSQGNPNVTKFSENIAKGKNIVYDLMFNKEDSKKSRIKIQE